MANMQELVCLERKGKEATANSHANANRIVERFGAGK